MQPAGQDVARKILAVVLDDFSSLSADVQERDVVAICAQMACEGTYGPFNTNGDDPLNPLDVEAPFLNGSYELGYWPDAVGFYNSVGVVRFGTLDDGIKACGENMRNGSEYADLRAALEAGDLAAFASAKGLDTWGTGSAEVTAKLKEWGYL